MSEWQPIETAPKGKVFLAYGGGVYRVACKKGTGSVFDSKTNQLLVRPRPTHWQPLPFPPKDAPQE